MFARTKRLLLRPGWADDAPMMADALCATPGACRPETHNWCLARARAVLSRALPASRPGLLIVRRGDHAPDIVGGIDLVDRHGAPGMACWVRADCRNRGYATEAGNAVIAIAIMLGIARIETPVDPDPAAAAFLRKLGFRATATGLVRHCAAAGPIDRLAA